MVEDGAAEVGRVEPPAPSGEAPGAADVVDVGAAGPALPAGGRALVDPCPGRLGVGAAGAVAFGSGALGSGGLGTDGVGTGRLGTGRLGTVTGGGGGTVTGGGGTVTVVGRVGSVTVVVTGRDGTDTVGTDTVGRVIVVVGIAAVAEPAIV